LTNLLEQVAKGVGISVGDAAKIIRTGPSRYRLFIIKKRDGGDRLIAQPSRELKYVQRVLGSLVLAGLPISDSAMAYRKGISIRLNALKHVGAKAILKLDFQDFFNSIEPDDLLRRLDSTLAMSNEELVRKSFFWWKAHRLCLAVGSPTSPLISNVVLYDFDEHVAKLANDSAVTYTRYADDITLSGDDPDRLHFIEASIATWLRNSASPRLHLNQQKRGLYLRGMKQMVTGLVLTPNGQISLGRDRKRRLSAGVNNIRKGKKNDQKHVAKVQGWLAFANSVEPSFVQRLEKKYGGIVVQLLHRTMQRQSNRRLA
jgi:RNA-directed DNA polymerase